MPSIDTVDSIEIEAPRERVFEAILDYPSMHTWFAACQCRLLQGEQVEEGSRVAHRVVAPFVRVRTDFVRTVRRIERPSRIEETYDEGGLVGKGVWSFVSSGDGRTSASFHCRVRSNNALMHVGFAMGGEFGHKLTYRRLLAALKVHCES